MANTDFDFDALTFSGEIPAKDPEPKATPKKASKSTRPVGRPSTQSKLQEVETEIGNVLKLALFPVLMRDIHEVYDENNNLVGTVSCANVYVEFDYKKGRPELTKEGTAFCEALAVIVFESPFLMKVLNAGDDMGKWLKLAMALQPAMMTVFHNHVRTRRIENAGENQVV